MRFPIGFSIVCVVLTGCAVSPNPLDDGQLLSYTEDKRARVVNDQEPLRGPVGLYEAMARALKYNLDKQVEVMEIQLRDRELRVAHYSKLPELVSGAGFDDRDNFSGGSSVRILDDTTVGSESLTSSSSSDRDVRSADLRFSWHILDFGLSYIRARQAADKVLIAEENRRRVVTRIVEDVRSAYWRAVTATRLVARLGRLEHRVNRAMRDTQELASKRDASPLTALTYERELVEIQREIRRLNGDLSVAKAQLAALMNVDPGDTFRVRVPGRMREPRLVGMNPNEMVGTALVNRSELREVAYHERINQHEAEAAIVEMLPGVSFSAAPNWNSNQYLFNNHWVAWGAQASWNLMKVFSYPARRAEVDAKDDLLDQRALAVTMAVMTQVHVSRARLIHARRKYRSAQHFYDVQSRIVHQIRSALAAGKVSEQTAIREEMNGLVAEVKRDLASAELQSAFATMYSSMGLAPYGDVDTDDFGVDGLQASLRDRWRELGDRST
ncbi:MAG: TolC family protein [Pseudomonadota bacterium]